HRQRLGTDHRDVDAQLLADHAARIADALLAVEGIADGQGVDDRPFRAYAAAVDGAQHALDVGTFDLERAQIDGGRERLRPQPPGGDVDDDGLDREAGGALGHADDGAYRMLGLVEIGDDAALDARGRAIAE